MVERMEVCYNDVVNLMRKINHSSFRLCIYCSQAGELTSATYIPFCSSLYTFIEYARRQQYIIKYSIKNNAKKLRLRRCLYLSLISGVACGGRSVCAVSSTECSSQQFQCRRSGLCIELRYKCDQRDDCDDASDEADCGNTSLQLHIDCVASACRLNTSTVHHVPQKETTLILNITSPSVEKFF